MVRDGLYAPFRSLGIRPYQQDHHSLSAWSYCFYGLVCILNLLLLMTVIVSTLHVVVDIPYTLAYEKANEN